MMSSTSPANQETRLTPVVNHELTNELVLKAKRELNEDPDTRHQFIEELRNKLKGEDGLYFKDDDDFLLQFLRAGKFDIERAFLISKKYYSYWNSDIFGNINFSVVKQLSKSGLVSFLPFRDRNGCQITCLNIAAWDPHFESTEAWLKLVFVYVSSSNVYPGTQISGYNTIVNFQNLDLKKHVLNIPVKKLLQFVRGLENGLPGRFKAVHLVHEGIFVRLLQRLLKLLLSHKLIQRVHFHGSNMESLHEFIDPSRLPEEFGGELGPFDSSIFTNEMEKFEQQFKELQGYGYKAKT